MKKNKNLCEAFQVKNDADGLKLIKTLRSVFWGTGFRIKVRGRNSNRKNAVLASGERYGNWIRQDCPIRFADRLAVYITTASGVHLKEVVGKDKERRQLSMDNRNLKIKLNTLKALINE